MRGATLVGCMAAPSALSGGAVSGGAVSAVPQRIGIIGGGVAGLACARRLQELGLDPVVYDTGKRSPGGRASSRSWGRSGVGGGVVDHAAQFASITTNAFADFIAPLEQAGTVVRWADVGIISPDGVFNRLSDGICRVVGVEGMQSIIAAASDGLDIRQDVWVSPNRGIQKESDGQWRCVHTLTYTLTTSPVPSKRYSHMRVVVVSSHTLTISPVSTKRYSHMRVVVVCNTLTTLAQFLPETFAHCILASDQRRRFTDYTEPKSHMRISPRCQSAPPPPVFAPLIFTLHVFTPPCFRAIDLHPP